MGGVTKEYRVRLFGRFQFTQVDGTDLTPNSRKSRAVIAICLLGGTRSVLREQIIELLWGDREEAQARASLRQAVYQLRDLDTGPDPVIGADRETVSVDSARVETDLHTLVRAIQSEAPDFVAARFAHFGSFLTDLWGLAPEFDGWLAQQRAWHEEALRSTVLDAAQGWIETDSDAALAVTNVLTGRDPLDELAARVAIWACAAKHDPDRARHVYTRLKEALWEQLGVEPAEETIAAFNAAKTAHHSAWPGTADRTIAETDPSAAKALPLPARRRFFPGKLDGRRTVLASAGVAVILAGLGAGAGYWMRSGKNAGKAFVVEPLTFAATDSAAEALSSGLSIDIAHYLPGPESNLRVVARDSNARSGAFLRLGGTASNSDGTLHASVRLQGQGDDTVLWSKSFEARAVDAGSLREQIAFWVSGVTDCAVGHNEGAPTGVERETLRLFLDACDNVMNGNPSFLTPLRKITETAPDFADGWYWYGQLQAVAGGYLGIEDLTRKSQVSANRAMTLDPDNPAPYAIFALAKPDMAHWMEREALLAKADQAPARFRGLSEYLHMVQMGAVGRRQEALSFAQRYLDAEPWDPPAYINLAFGWAFSGYLVDSLQVLDRISAVEPDEPTTKAARITIHATVGNAQEALRLLEAYSGLQLFSPIEHDAIVALAEARLDPAKTDSSLETFRQLAGKASPDQKLLLLQYMVIIGRIDAAYRLARGLPRFQIYYQESWYHNFMAPFRADRRFPALIEKQGAPDIWRKTGILPNFCREERLDYDCRQAFSMPAEEGK